MTRALVLSGGGSVGIAWQTGLAAGLARKGVQLRQADSIIGTSAGSAVGAQLALGTDLEERLVRYRKPSTGTSAAARTAAAGTSTGPASTDRMAKLMAVMAEAAENEDEVAGRAALGRFALDADALPEEQLVAGFSYLRDRGWPEGYACTAVDAETGELVVWDGGSGAPLERAVASSCAVPGIFAPITIDGRRYIDGGMRSATNADLAEGHDVVVLVSLMSPARMAAASADPRALRFLARMESELRALTEGGATVEVVTPDDQAAAAIGLDLMDATLAPGAAVEGVRQGEDVAEQLGAFWG